MKKILFVFTIFCATVSTLLCENSKIVGLIAARNEAAIIEQCLHSLSLYTDAIVFLDDASTDETKSIVESVACQYNVEQILHNKLWFRNEPSDRNRLLQAGREIGGTHFIVIDADELFSANLLIDDTLKNLVLSLKKGDKIIAPWIQLWRSHTQYRDDNSIWAKSQKIIAFCDDQKCFYQSEFIHTAPAPYNLRGETIVLTDRSAGLLHFQFVNWRNLRLKQAWYACLEHIRWPQKPCWEINQRYAPAKDESDIVLCPAPDYWFKGYSFFDETVFQAPILWHQNQIMEWFDSYGIDFFKELDIWDIDWQLLLQK